MTSLPGLMSVAQVTTITQDERESVVLARSAADVQWRLWSYTEAEGWLPLLGTLNKSMDSAKRSAYKRVIGAGAPTIGIVAAVRDGSEWPEVGVVYVMNRADA